MTVAPVPTQTARPAFGALLLAALLPSIASGETLRVPGDFSAIQSAIDAAEPDDVVLVEPGTYAANLVMRSNVDVVGRETARTLLEPADSTVATVTIENVTGARVSNFTLIGASVGVSVRSSAGIDVANVVFDRAEEIGLAVDGSSVEALNNVFYQNEVAISRGGAATEAVNNIFAGNGTAISTGQPAIDPFASVRANCYFDNDASPSESDAGGGAGAVFGDPMFVAPDERDFHLREGSSCIDAGRGMDVIDGTTADAGAWGGPFADRLPHPVPAPELSAAGGEDASIEVSWQRNLSYRVTNSANPGGYRVYYKRGGPGEDNEPDDYDGDGAAGGPSPIDAGDTTSYTLDGLDAQADTPVAPRLSTAEGRDGSVILAWEASDGATGYRVHYGIEDTGENIVDVGDALRHTVTGLTNGTEYRFAVSAVARARYQVAVSVLDNTQNRHESVLSPPASIELGEAAESGPSQALTATPAPILPHPDLPDTDRCFIATAAFGARWSAPVRVLRELRDRYLLTHAPGRWLVGRYYALSRPAARFIDEHEALKPVVRAALMPLVVLALVLLEAPLAAGAVLAAAAVALVRRVSRRPALRKPVRRGSRRRRVVFACAAALVCVTLPAGAAEAEEGPRSPRWMYEIKGGYFYPELEGYERFYGEDRTTSFAVAGAYRFNDWLEAGVEIARATDRGAGRVPGGEDVPDAVKQTLIPVSAYAGFVFEGDGRRLVPYAGLGATAVFYEQEIDLQADRDGRADAGVFARAGLRWRFAERGARGETRVSSRRGTPFMRSYVFAEAQHHASEIEGIELGGNSYVLGVRIEFDYRD